jgi:putative hydrolase of HD superfamily
MNLQKLLSFVKLTQDFRDVHRQIIFKKSNSKENDVEHSFQLAIVAWYLVDSHKFDLDTNLIVKYALVHDLVEVYAGDTPMNSKDDVYVAGKMEREKEAEKRIAKEFSEFDEMVDCIHAYENKVDKESKFVYALDKLLPVLSIYLDEGHSWKVDKIPLEMIIESKTNKIALSPEIKVYFDELIEILKKEESNLFF